MTGRDHELVTVTPGRFTKAPLVRQPGVAPTRKVGWFLVVTFVLEALRSAGFDTPDDVPAAITTLAEWAPEAVGFVVAWLVRNRQPSTG